MLILLLFFLCGFVSASIIMTVGFYVIEKRLYKVSIYLTFEEKEELLGLVGQRKLSTILRSILFDWMRRNRH